MNTQFPPLKYYKTRYGGYGLVPADSAIVGDAVEVGAARKEEWARLLAAAPELFAQLKALAIQLEQTGLIVPPGVKAAMAKATGGQP